MNNEGSGRQTISGITENRAHVDTEVLDKRRVTVSELEHDLGLSHGILVRIIEQLGFHKIRARWISRAPSEDHKSQRMFSALSSLQLYAIYGHNFV
jgi:DNA-binding MarR family transcriptional regulator